MANRSNWKGCERAIAAKMGGQRLSNHALGQAVPDVETDAYSVECKVRQLLPAWLTGAVEQAYRNATPGKLPLVVLHEAGRRHDNDLVVVRLKDFVEMWGDVTPEPTCEQLCAVCDAYPCGKDGER